MDSKLSDKELEILNKIDFFAGFKNPIQLLVRLRKFLLDQSWDETFNSPDHVIDFLEFITMSERINDQPANPVDLIKRKIPCQPVKFDKPVDKCMKCGIMLTTVTNYYCNSEGCPTGLGGAKCQS